MAEKDSESHRTRRARRREQSEGSDSTARQRDDAEREAPPSGAPRAEKSSAPPKAATGEGRRESIRDRNQRLREKAAEERRRRRKPEKVEEIATGLDASEMVDDVLARTSHTVTRWVKRHSMLVQSALVLGFLGLVGVSVWRIYARETTAKRSDELFVGVEARLGSVGESPEVLNVEGRNIDPRATFATEAERNAKAEEAYRAVAGTHRAVAVLGELGLAGVLFDSGKYDEAKAAYETVRATKVAENNVELKARSIEGIGLSQEAKGDLDGAAKTFGELENLSEPSFADLGTYHRARLAMRKGDQAKAKELVGKLKEKLDKPADDNLRFSYTALATAELAQALEPAGTPWMPGLSGLEDTKKSVKDMQRWVEEISKGNIPEDLAPAGSASAAPAGSGSAAPGKKKAPGAPHQQPRSAAPGPAPATSR